MDAALLQAGVVVPLVLGLTARVVLRPRHQTVQWLLAGLLLAIAAWVGANAWSEARHGTAWGAGGEPALLVAAALSPLFLLTMAFHLRLERFERSPGLCAAVCVPFVVFALLVLTDDAHHLMFIAAPAPGVPLRAWAGPGFWAFQIWSYGYVLLGVGLAVLRVRPSAPPEERWRAALVVAASLAPVVAHTSNLLRWPPLDFPLTPAALGVSALLLVVAIDRYALLDAQPLPLRDALQRTAALDDPLAALRVQLTHAEQLAAIVQKLSEGSLAPASLELSELSDVVARAIADWERVERVATDLREARSGLSRTR